MSSAAVVISALRVNMTKTLRKYYMLDTEDAYSLCVAY